MMGEAKPKVVIIGGGFGGLESAFSLRKLLGGKADLTLVSDKDHFLFKPNTIYVPFGADPERLKFGLEKPTKRKNIEFVNARVHEIDPDQKRVSADGRELAFDYLVVATGAGMRSNEVPGLDVYGETIWTPADMLKLRRGLDNLVEDSRQNRRRQVLFLVPPNNKCSGPLYELGFMLDTWLRRKGARSNVEITWSTYEKSFIQAFGSRLHEVAAKEFARRGIAAHTDYAVERVEEGEAAYRNGERLPFDLLISFPPYVAGTPFPGLPADERGFITTDLSTRQVIGHPEIYAVGDAGDFPVKQAFLAFLQADAAAEHLAAQIKGKGTPSAFDPTSMCVMEQFDRATFAQVPLRLTGIADAAVAVREEDARLYRVGTSPVWRLGKKMLGVYLPWRFKAGNPFHAGLPWRAMELGLKVMSKTMAR